MVLLDVIDVKPLEDYKILVTFENNEKKIFDITPLFERGGKWLELRDESLFRSVHVWDGTVQWLHGQDICPTWLYEDSVPVKASGLCSAECNRNRLFVLYIYHIAV